MNSTTKAQNIGYWIGFALSAIFAYMLLSGNYPNWAIRVLGFVFLWNVIDKTIFFFKSRKVKNEHSKNT